MTDAREGVLNLDKGITRVYRVSPTGSFAGLTDCGIGYVREKLEAERVISYPNC